MSFFGGFDFGMKHCWKLSEYLEIVWLFRILNIIVVAIAV